MPDPPKPFDFASFLAPLGQAIREVAEDAVRAGAEGAIEELQAQAEGISARLAGVRAKVRKPARPARIQARQVREEAAHVVRARPKKKAKRHARARRRA